MKLFDYQKKVLDTVFSDPCKQQLVSMPTGTGKTITFLSLAKEYDKNTLIIVHREELLNQTYEKAIKLGIDPLQISIFSSAKKETGSKICIAMVQTLCRNLSQFTKDDFDLMIIDEAHHATSDSYLKIIDYFDFRDSEKLLIGFTATPLRSDGRLLSHLFKSHSYKMTLSEATQLGYIVPVRGIKINMEKSLKDLDVIGNDYDLSQLDKVMNCEEVNNVIVERCKSVLFRPGIIFTTSIDHAEKIKDLLNTNGINSQSVNYKTSKSDLLSIYEKLKKGEIDFVTNAVKLSEGFDEPNIRSVIIARPTRSPILYKQMIGRGLRNHENKDECFVLEFTPNDNNMVSWDEIDQNSTFQSFTPGQTRDIKSAKTFYESRFNSSQIVVNDVRISPFNFYECELQRLITYKKHYKYMNFKHGVIFFRYIPTANKKWEGVNLAAWAILWKKPYETFSPWDDMWLQSWREFTHPSKNFPGAYPVDYFEKWIVEGYLKKQPTFMGRWYPSEEEPISNRQKKLLSKFMKKIPDSMKARKAEFEIEDYYIQEIINKYFMDEKFPKDLKEGFI